MAKKKNSDIWSKVPTDSRGNYLEAATNDEPVQTTTPDKLLTTLYPIEKEGDEIYPFETVNMPPNSSQTWWVNGREGAVINMRLIRVPNSGGHQHGGSTSNASAVGIISPRTFTLGKWPQNIICVHRAPMVCGTIRLRTEATAGGNVENTINVLVAGLVPINSSTNLRLKTPTGSHPSPYFVTPSFGSKLTKIANEYANERNKPITVTDASLPWGGRFDLRTNWRPPHHEHMFGNEADIRSRDMRRGDKKAFLRICEKYGVSVLEESDHWHVRG